MTLEVKLLLVIAIFLAGATAGWKVQDWRYGNQEKERVKAQVVAEQEARKIESKRQTQVIEAQNAANLRTQTLVADAAGARSERDRLRDTIAATSPMPVAACHAEAEYSNTLRIVLNDCAEAYAGVAAKADGHASDVQTLEDAWPKP